VIGAREFLIAYNVNLNTRDKKLANVIAQALREAGRSTKSADGTTTIVPGRFKECRAVGWYIEEFGRAQVSINLTNYKVTPLHAVFDAACEEAAKLGLRVTGSELVGLIPREALLAAGDHYLSRQGKTNGIPEKERVHTAVLSLGLSELGAFDALRKVIEYRYADGPPGLVGMTVRDFADELSSSSPAPGGGSVSALCGALSASLAAMVAALTWSKAGMEAVRPAMQTAGAEAQTLKDWFLGAVDRDTQAWNAVLATRRLPKKSAEEIAARAGAIERASQNAAKVPLDVLEATIRMLELSLQAVNDGNPNSVSDAGTAGACALAAAEGAALNVRINARALIDRSVAEEYIARQAGALARARDLADKVSRAVDAVLG
jgi:glutamate formiminotransferase/formiminotetrahydrofolate cyclodeaminase